MRFIVIGTSGCGKSTFGKALAKARGVRHVELDALFWLPNWTQRTAEDFRQRTLAATSDEGWVVDGNYSSVRDVLWSRATHIVWLNYSRLTVHGRVLRRTISRAITAQELWSGNRESFRRALLSKDSILLWSVSTFEANRRKYRALRASGQFPHLAWHELRSPREAEAFLSRHQDASVRARRSVR